MSREALYDENQTLKNLVQAQQAEIEELQRLLAQAEMRIEELAAQAVEGKESPNA